MRRLPEIIIPPGQIDDILKSYRYPCRFILQAGEYTTRGIWNFLTNFDCCMLPPQSELIGPGSHLTTLKLSNVVKSVNSSGIYPQYAVLTGGNRSKGSNVLPSSQIKVSGLTIDCDNSMPTIGLHLWTSNAIVSDVIIKNVLGDFKTNWEGFGILINNSGNDNNECDGGHLIKDSKIYVKAGAYVTGLYVGCSRRTCPLEHSLVDNCKIMCYGNDTAPHAAFGINSHLTIRNCEVYGFNHAIFNDTGDTHDTFIINSIFKNIRYGYLVLRANSSGWDRTNIISTNCIIEFNKVDSDHAVLLVCDDQSPTKNKSRMKNITISDSIVTNKSNKTFYYGSLNGELFSNISLQRNILPDNNMGVVIASLATSSMWIFKDNVLQ